MTESADPPGAPRRKRLSIDDVFGEVLPDTSEDERTPEPGETREDTWYQDNRPPHHDRD